MRFGILLPAPVHRRVHVAGWRLIPNHPPPPIENPTQAFLAALLMCYSAASTAQPAKPTAAGDVSVGVGVGPPAEVNNPLCMAPWPCQRFSSSAASVKAWAGSRRVMCACIRLSLAGSPLLLKYSRPRPPSSHSSTISHSLPPSPHLLGFLSPPHAHAHAQTLPTSTAVRGETQQLCLVALPAVRGKPSSN